MKILLLGKTGLIGQALFRCLSLKFQIDAPPRSECNVENEDDLIEYVSQTKPDIVINSTGYSNVDLAEKEFDKAFSLNVTAVSNIVKACNKINVPILHISSDYVFDGENEHGYLENDTDLNPLSKYGRTKADGEKIILNEAKKYYLVRTEWVYGEGGTNFVDKILLLANKGTSLNVVNDQIGNPTYTKDFAESVSGLLEASPYGIYHIVNEGDVSWADFAREIFKCTGIPQEVIGISSEELNRPALRPNFSMLRNTKLPGLRNWKEAISEYLMNKIIIL